MSNYSCSEPPYNYTTACNGEFTMESLQVRVPFIVTEIINTVHRQVSKALTTDPSKAEDGKLIISQLTTLIHEMSTNKPLTPIQDDHIGDIPQINSFLSKYYQENTWIDAPFLYWETYLYRRIAGIFLRSNNFKSFDYFADSKKKAFLDSVSAIAQLVAKVDLLVSECSETSASVAQDTIQKRKLVGFLEILQISLWGNQTDLSMFPDLKTADLEKMQANLLSGDNKHNLVSNDSEAIFHIAESAKADSISIVLDNSGFELFGDLLLAHWLIELGYTSKVIFHSKNIPWYVSDVTPWDFSYVVDSCANKDTFINDTNKSDPSFLENIATLSTMAQKWQSHLKSGVWQVQSHHFWTGPYQYTLLPEIAPDLWATLSQSNLVFFKGDLNYRKLISDLAWPTDTPFVRAIGAIADSTTAPAIIALRTSKAEVMVGVDPETFKPLDKNVPNWKSIGKYGVIQCSSGRFA
ncbi:hypothetical protein BB561_000599 [Smittium simulii]|uniref:Sugar phosphate phosphatase n=1 Tax=Smittium simulii TaxID=133385 RepID=A0A2T9YYH1_9FUNG|nr:hypothetical protein BB561_000599 [Smittium simulii]